eukprot:TRINITY_DN9167_c0_g1_i4.p1 TRINITY_DN9167_c0_g1~~TRINITY_DN9167_c0_g1_i4.p1  ORF type:complete len:119 (-),score=12.75 TRINITY_DN9167_c0_g1_i4:41-397(-)
MKIVSWSDAAYNQESGFSPLNDCLRVELNCALQPGSNPISISRREILDAITRQDAVAAFPACQLDASSHSPATFLPEPVALGWARSVACCSRCLGRRQAREGCRSYVPATESNARVVR